MTCLMHLVIKYGNMYLIKKPLINSSLRFSFPVIFSRKSENNSDPRHAMTTQYGIIRMYLREQHNLNY